MLNPESEIRTVTEISDAERLAIVHFLQGAGIVAHCERQASAGA